MNGNLTPKQITLSPQMQQIQDYFAQNRIKELYARLVYEVTLYRPNDPIQFMISRLEDFKKIKKEQKQKVLDPTVCAMPNIPKVIFVLGAPRSGKSTNAKKIADVLDMHYVK